MPRNGSGTFNLPAGNPVVTGTTIDSTVQNNTTSDIATALTNSLAKDGQTTPTANLPMGGFKLTGMASGSARTDSAAISNIQDGTGFYIGTVGGTVDVITLTPAPAFVAYTAGQLVSFISSGSNTTNVTVNVSSLGAKAVTKNGSVALVAGDIPSGSLVSAVYDGAQFQLVRNGTILETIVNAKGDLIAGTASDTVTRVAAGTNGFILQADSTATPGIAYKAPSVVSGASSNLQIKNNAGTPNTQIDVSANEVIVKNTDGAAQVLSSLSVTVNFATTGAAGLDAGSQTLSTWYYLWAIAKADGTKTVIGSASASSPTMPTDYTFKALIGAVYSNSSNQFRKFYQLGGRVIYAPANLALSSGSATSITEVNCATFVPPNALSFTIFNRIFQITSSSGIAKGNVDIDFVSGDAALVNWVYMDAGQHAVDRANAINGSTAEVPNISQRFYYKITVANGTGPSANIDVTGFILPVGE